jgi:cellulose synthase/poly-beta-1,6-N-acetylglucosamine synthase-like glycosyltransferase
MDKLEEHIRKNREDLDRYSPPKGIWKNIRKKLTKDKYLSRQWISIAAMIVVILGTAVIFFRPEYRLSSSDKQKNRNDDLTLIVPQLKETETYYNNLINSLYSEAKPLLTNNPVINKELNSDLSQLDSICTDLKKDLKDNIANQDVVEALIQNYRIKIRILEDMLKVLKENETNPEKPKSHEL